MLKTFRSFNIFVKKLIYIFKKSVILKKNLFTFCIYLFFLFLKIKIAHINQITAQAKISKNQCNHQDILEKFIKITNIQNIQKVFLYQAA